MVKFQQKLELITASPSALNLTSPPAAPCRPGGEIQGKCRNAKSWTKPVSEVAGQHKLLVNDTLLIYTGSLLFRTPRTVRTIRYLRAFKIL